MTVFSIFLKKCNLSGKGKLVPEAWVRCSWSTGPMRGFFPFCNTGKPKRQDRCSVTLAHIEKTNIPSHSYFVILI